MVEIHVFKGYEEEWLTVGNGPFAKVPCWIQVLYSMYMYCRHVPYSVVARIVWAWGGTVAHSIKHSSAPPSGTSVICGTKYSRIATWHPSFSLQKAVYSCLYALVYANEGSTGEQQAERNVSTGYCHHTKRCHCPLRQTSMSISLLSPIPIASLLAAARVLTCPVFSPPSHPLLRSPSALSQVFSLC